MNYTLEEKIEHLKDAVLKHVPIKYMYLFGSHAYGEPSDDSDIDLYVVIPDDVQNIPFLYADIMGELADRINYIDIDLHINNESSFNKYRMISSFEETIYQRGKLLYENI